MKAALNPGKDSGRAGYLCEPAGAVEAASGPDGASEGEGGGTALAVGPRSSVEVRPMRR